MRAGEGHGVDRQVVEEAARPAVGRVNRAEKAPAFWEELSDAGGFHFLEKRASVDASKMGEVPHVVDFFGDNCEALLLDEVEPGCAHEIAG